ncbi:fimbrial protein [Salmonella enterica subsp. enterica serovar Bovismorbificans]|uniref:Fimbrial protein n=4 Tax=Salmonella enterica TaxID=28901 RepID=A0A5U0S8F9_SALER|nr:fimbrial protein [Salmonella enterica]EBV4569316.1 fimbrial protein StiA [Salmonella enterica subsp. enterica serovar Nima]EBW2599533.1 fimbrial protein StiA [Salmonella enterica subsp. enterica serovar Poano]EBW3290232.1 fimbrial protein StiA [Salmonella enterica subsp. enterica serovar Bijlmer]EBW6903243.1 fimbrial protein StiA [Salmonella enterica subsp. enterica serovar Duisburg]EBY1389974.1 fimbrial protein StiA [Salmonella enterica subsp. enterica serovar Wagenia]ECA4029919.1 fimbria
MKLTLQTLTVVLAAITLSPAALADTAKDGTVHIYGAIKLNACTVTTDSVDVTLQDEFASLFTAAGQTAGDKDFTIDLENCDANIYSNVQARFEGTLDGTDATILKNDADATNIGVQILDKTSTPMTFNDLQAWSASVALPTEEGVTTLSMPFTARYIATAVPVESGNVDATATFYLQYN